MYSSRGSNAFGQQSYAAQSAAYGASVSFFSVNQSKFFLIFSCVLNRSFVGVMWEIWRDRNNCIYNGVAVLVIKLNLLFFEIIV